jgi:hypothetical protein
VLKLIALLERPSRGTVSVSGFNTAKIKAGKIPAFAEILYSPVHGVCDPKALVEWLLDARLRGRLQLQLHKYIWSPSTRGV